MSGTKDAWDNLSQNDNGPLPNNTCHLLRPSQVLRGACHVVEAGAPHKSIRSTRDMHATPRCPVMPLDPTLHWGRSARSDPATPGKPLPRLQQDRVAVRVSTGAPLFWTSRRRGTSAVSVFVAVGRDCFHGSSACASCANCHRWGPRLVQNELPGRVPIGSLAASHKCPHTADCTCHSTLLLILLVTKRHNY